MEYLESMKKKEGKEVMENRAPHSNGVEGKGEKGRAFLFDAALFD